MSGTCVLISAALCSPGFEAGETRPAGEIASRVPRQETGAESGHLTGSWGGLRKRLVERGLHFSAGYSGEVLSNLSGGIREGAVYEGLLELGLDMDFERLGLWRNGSARVSSLYPHGRGLTEHYTGDLLTASNIDAYDSFRLFELWYEHRFFDERFSVRVGQLAADEEFAFTEGGGLFLNSGFGWPAFVSGNVPNGGAAFFAAGPGARIRVEPAEDVYFQAGVYDGDAFDSREGDPRVNGSGTRIHLSGGQGFLVMAEAGLRTSAGEGALPGEYKAGAWVHTGGFTSNYEDEQGGSWVLSGLASRKHGANYGIYLGADQWVWMEAGGGGQGLALFARAGAAPEDRNLFELVVDGGFNCTGLIPGRDEDVFGAGVIYARLSDDIRRREREDAKFNGAAYEAFSSHELVVEVSYAIQAAEWLLIQPDFQWIHHPGGSAALPDAFVAGVRAAITF